jgi:ABC-type uncharacterized transport system auxiliary subunit
MRRRLLLRGMIGAVLGGAVLGGTGCSVLPSQPYLQRRDWPLMVRRPGDVPGDRPGAPANRTNGRILLVRPMLAGPGLEVRGLQLLQADGSVQTAFYEQWAVAPAQSVDDDLRRWLADSGMFAAVVPSGSRLTADLVLESELVALHADLGSGTARAALALVLIDQLATPAIRLERTETATVGLEGIDPASLVRAQRAAVEAVLRQTEAALAEVLRR